MSITEVCVRRPVLAWMIMLATIVFGVVAAGRIGVSQMPDVDFPTITVNITWEGAAPEVECRIDSWNTSRSLITNRNAPPFDNPEIRKAIALALDSKQFIDQTDDAAGWVHDEAVEPF